MKAQGPSFEVGIQTDNAWAAWGRQLRASTALHTGIILLKGVHRPHMRHITALYMVIPIRIAVILLLTLWRYFIA